MSKDNDSLICFIPIFLDFIMVVILVGYGLLHSKFHLHIAICIIGGILAGVALIALMYIKILGIILQIICSVFWTLILTGLIEKLFHYTAHPVWKWVLPIISFLLILLWHMVGLFSLCDYDSSSYKEKRFYQTSASKPAATYKPISVPTDKVSSYDPQLERLQTARQTVKELFSAAIEEAKALHIQAEQIINTYTGTPFRELTILTQKTSDVTTSLEKTLSDYLTCEKQLDNIFDFNEGEPILRAMTGYVTLLHTTNQELFNQISVTLPLIQSQKEAAHNSYLNNNTSRLEENLFSGCTNKDSLTKRYRNLMKIYHPDNGDGDMEMTKKIQNTYEELLKNIS